MRITTYIIPREHGAWAMLLVPLLLGIGVSGSCGPPSLLFAGAAVGVYIARTPLVALVKHARLRRNAVLWIAVSALLLVSGIAFLALLFFYRRWGLLSVAGAGLVLALTHIAASHRRAERAMAVEFVGIVLLSLTSPAGYYAGTGRFDIQALMLWLVNSLYFAGTVFYVRFMIRVRPKLGQSARARQRLAAGTPALAFHLLAPAGLVVLTLAGLAPALIPVAFVPSLVKLCFGLLHKGNRPSTMRLGISEIAHAVLFTTLVLAGYR